MIKNELESVRPYDDELNGIYRGVVEDNKNDPKKAGRIKIRVFGIHTKKKEINSSGTDGIPTEHLPWAEPATSLFEGGVSGFGSWKVPLQGAHVWLFFENGNIMKPVYFASAPGIPEERGNPNEGFSDPDNKYPKDNRLGEPDFHRLGREKTEDTILTYKNSNLDKNVNAAYDEEWSEPESAYNTQYPHNALLVSHAGLTVEFDSTPGEERYHIFHPSNSYIELDKEGNMVVRNNNNKFQIVRGSKKTHIIIDEYKTIDNDRRKSVGNDEIMEVNGEQREYIENNRIKETGGDNFETIGGKSEILIETTSNVSIKGARNVYSGTSINMDSSMINLNCGFATQVTPKKPKE